LAMGDIWYGGVTKNPWNLAQGSSGSSAGSAAATSAGLVSFAIGSETLGSIVSPSTRCGTTGLRPTYGRVSRTGAMALSWSMDKLGPICRSAKDAAIVFEALRQPDPMDQTLIEADFNYTSGTQLSQLKIGYLKGLFEADYPNKGADEATLEVLRSLGAELQEVSLPTDLPIDALLLILMAEAAAAFDDLTRENLDDLLVNQRRNAWPNLFRTARFIPAVEYIQANRVRYQLIQQMHALMRQYDVVVAPSFGGNQLLITNLTGQPCVVVPNGFNDKGSPVSISFLGNLFDEATVLAVAEAYQEATNFHRQYPPLFR
jgi:Asp-tRNA(Asn)/Glu-tRNA(Gln) amidotransferase A subunit family amidase